MPPLPLFAELKAPDQWRAIDFISDLHLSPQVPRTFEAWAAFMRGSRADAIFILGDLLEVWVGDDSRHGEFEASCVAVLNEAATSHDVRFMAGNRDFLIGQDMLTASHAALLPDPTVVDAFGRRVLLSHGDELCRADVDYQRYRALVRSATFQQQFLSKPLVERQAFVRKLRDDSEARRRAAGQTQNVESMADLDRLETLAWMNAAAAHVLVHGHTHQPADEALDSTHLRHVLSDWELDAAGPAQARSEVLRWSARGFERMSPLAAVTTAPEA